MAWTEERIAILSKLWADGFSASQIAREMGGITRNAVIGKVHRLGLAGRAKSASSSQKHIPRKPRANSYNARPRNTAKIKNANGDTGENGIRTDDMIIPESKKLELIQLTEKTCKWPHGDPGSDALNFCGHNTMEDKPYCEYHCKLAYQQNIDRRREPLKIVNG